MNKTVSEPFYEDFKVGDTFKAGSIKVTLEMIKEFAAMYDPQPMHLDEEAAKDSIFGELVGSGWQTACLTMRLMALAKPFGDRGVIGVEVQNLQWPKPMLPGDTLTPTGEIIKTFRSKTKPLGFFHIKIKTRNQHDEVIFMETWTTVLPTRD